MPAAAPHLLDRPDPEASFGTARRVRRHQRQQMVRMGCASYFVDSGLLLALALAGGLALHVPVFYLVAGVLVSGFFHLLLGTGWSERFNDHYLVGPQMVAHAAIHLGFAWYAPEIGVLLVMLLFIVFAFGALRVDARRIASGSLFGSLIVASAVIALMVLIGDRLALPAATWVQRALCGLWVALVLARSTLVGLYAAKLHALLRRRNEELADTFEKLEYMATRDELTGALSRRSVTRLLAEERQRMERTGQRFGIALFDLDHFKQVNDSFGHLVSDEALKQFTRVAAGSMRSTDRLARYGGEEFLLLLTSTGDEAAARTAADRVREGTASHDWAAVAEGLKLTVSAGVALCEPAETIEQLLARADDALYQAKRSGRNQVNVAVPTASPAPPSVSPAPPASPAVQADATS